MRRQHAGAVTGVNSSLLNVLHDAADPDALAVAERIYIYFDCVLEEAIEVDRAAVLANVAREIVLKVVLRVNDLHRAPTEHVAWPHQQREADVG